MLWTVVGIVVGIWIVAGMLAAMGFGRMKQ